MWSKQADPRSKNNMTSFRNKITNRKSRNDNSESTESPADNKIESEKKKQAQLQQQQQQRQQTKVSNSKNNRNRTRNKNKKDGGKSGEKEDEKKKGVADTKPKSNDEPDKTVDECDGVVLRNPGAVRTHAASVKRYSDSFVIENQTPEENPEKEKVSTPTPLTRALSGFFVLEKKHNRRFSDLFRPVSNKFSGSTESLKIPLKLEKNVPEKMPKKEAKIDTNKTKLNKKTDSTKKAQAKNETPKTATTETSNSYLKRVRSKIYKSKSDDCSKIELDNKYKKLKPKKSLDLNGRIPEEDVVSPTGIQKSLGHFHFGRLTRQTTNLERISRPFGSQISVETAQTPPSERPALAKSKSSSAINLSLLRTRRAKLMEQVSAPLCKDEFDFIAFGDVRKSDSSTSLHKFPSWLHLNRNSQREGDNKSSQPVARSGSDRRPDSVREEGARTVEENPQGEGALDHMDSSGDKRENAMPQESSSSSQSAGAKRRAAGHINRSESVKEQSEKIRKQQRRNISDPSHAHNTSYDIDDRQDLTKNTDSGSSSNSSISAVNGRLSESPSTSMDVHQATVRTQSDSDSDMDDETDPLHWQELVTEEELKKLNPNEKKRQEVINELFLTEASHVRMLKVLYKVFYRTLQSSQMLKPDELNLLFPNIKELLDMHMEINKEMRRIRKEDPLVRQIGDMLLSTFSGSQGEQLQEAAATFCERQQLALEFIKKRRERDNKFDSFLSDFEKKKRRQCRRLQLQEIVPYEMQRLTRYPLLLERLTKSVEAAEKTCPEYKEELIKLRQAHHYSKDILSFVNEAAKVAHNKHRLEEIQRHLDVSNFRNSDHPIVNDFKNIDLTRYKLILEGGLQLRRPNKAPVPVHVLLMEEMVVILQKESEKFILKFFQSGASTQMSPLSPIIKMNTLLVRENAVCKNALFLVNTSTTSSQMYDLQAEDESKRETWRRHFSDAADAYCRREGKPQRIISPPQNIEPIIDPDSEPIRPVSEPEPPVEEPSAAEADVEKEPSVEEDPAAGGDHTPDDTLGDGVITTKVSVDEWPLIQPSQVNVEVPPVHTAESMLTPLEQIRRKDALVKQALSEKEDLVADMLAIPREHFEHIADMASIVNEGEAKTSDITDRLLASVFQVDILQKAVNDALNITEIDVMAAKGGKNASCASQEVKDKSVIPSVPAGLVGDIAASLSSQLTTLLSEIKLVEEDRDRLRTELHKIREQLHEECNVHSPVPCEEMVLSDENAQEVFCEAISDEPN